MFSSLVLCVFHYDQLGSVTVYVIIIQGEV